MPSKMKVVLGRGQGSMPIDTNPLPTPKMKAPPMGNSIGDSAPVSSGKPMFGGGMPMPVSEVPQQIRDLWRDGGPSPYGGGGMKPGAVGPAGQDPFYGGAGRGQVFGGGPSGRADEMRGMPMPGGGGRGMFMDARINPDGSVSGRNNDNEFDEWAVRNPRMLLQGGGMGGAYRQGDEPGSPWDDIVRGASDARESMLGLDNPRRITRPPLAPSPRSGGKPPQKPVRKLKKKRLMPRKPRPINKLGGE